MPPVAPKPLRAPLQVSQSVQDHQCVAERQRHLPELFADG